MSDKLVILCDDMTFSVQDGELQTIIVGNSKPFNYRLYCQKMDELEKEMLYATSYADQKMAFYESNELFEKFKALIAPLKRYNSENSNPFLESLYKHLTEKEVKRLQQFIGKSFFNS